MDIPNLSQTPPADSSPTTPDNQKILVLIIIFISIALGFWISRVAPSSTVSTSSLKNGTSLTGQTAVNTENIADPSDIKIGVVYGNLAKNFTDSAVGVIESGSINSEGTHILVREGGLSQRASLTSSAVDLDLFVGRKVEVKGETNASNKTSWLMDVGSVKVLE